jgi:hypothetical protein
LIAGHVILPSFQSNNNGNPHVWARPPKRPKVVYQWRPAAFHHPTMIDYFFEIQGTYFFSDAGIRRAIVELLQEPRLCPFSRPAGFEGTTAVLAKIANVPKVSQLNLRGSAQIA